MPGACPSRGQDVPLAAVGGRAASRGPSAASRGEERSLSQPEFEMSSEPVMGRSEAISALVLAIRFLPSADVDAEVLRMAILAPRGFAVPPSG